MRSEDHSILGDTNALCLPDFAAKHLDTITSGLTVDITEWFLINDARSVRITFAEEPYVEELPHHFVDL